MLAAGNPVRQHSRSLLGEIGYTAAHTRHIQVLNNTLQWWSAAGELVSTGRLHSKAAGAFNGDANTKGFALTIMTLTGVTVTISAIKWVISVTPAKERRRCRICY